MALAMPDDEDIVPLSLNYLMTLYRHEALHISCSSSSVRNARHFSVCLYDVNINGMKGCLNIYQHTRDEVRKGECPMNLALFRNEIETLKVTIVNEYQPLLWLRADYSLSFLKVVNASSPLCPNIIGLLAARQDFPAHIITERPTKGDLLSYLQSNNKNPIKAKVLHKMSLDVYNAMSFLAQQRMFLSHQVIY